MRSVRDNEMCWLFYIYMYKVPIKASVSEWVFDTAVLSYLLEMGEGREDIGAFRYLISCAVGQCEDQKEGASVLVAAFKVCACICRVRSMMQLKWSLIRFCLFTWIELGPIDYLDMLIHISKLCAIFYAEHTPSPCLYFLCSRGNLLPCKQMNCLLFRQNKNIPFGNKL